MTIPLFVLSDLLCAFVPWWLHFSYRFSCAALINQRAEFGQLGRGELAPFDEVGGEAVGGAVEEAVDEFE